MTRMRALFRLLLLLVSPTLAWAQGGLFNGPTQILDSQGQPRPAVTFCTSAGTPFPCTPTPSIFSDPGLRQQISFRQTTDGLGNLPTVYAVPRTYKLSGAGTG